MHLSPTALFQAIRMLSKDDIKLRKEMRVKLNQVFTKGEKLEEMQEKLNIFRKETEEMEDLLQGDTCIIN